MKRLTYVSLFLLTNMVIFDRQVTTDLLLIQIFSLWNLQQQYMVLFIAVIARAY